MRISIELVPRSAADLDRQLDAVARFATVDTVNIPDITRFPLRSWQASARACARGTRPIPHLRAIDIDLARPLSAAPVLAESGISEVLLVAGDAPVDMSRPVYPTSTLQAIRKLATEHPSWRIYAGFDPYRQGFREELAYAVQKLEAGAVGLFTQPFFDLRLMEVVGEMLDGIEVFWGVTSVTSEASQRYWMQRNAVVFPKDFEPTLEWNQRFARDALAFARLHDASIYFMPIRASLQDYLGGIL